jgi:hypothetical protein
VHACGIAQLQGKDVHGDGAQAAGRRVWKLGLMEELGVLGQADVGSMGKRWPHGETLREGGRQLMWT